MSEYLKIRQFDKEKDSALVAGWWIGRGQTPVHPSEFTTSGIVAIVNGKPTACAWLFVNNRSHVATVENLISDPKASDEHVKHASELIFDFFRGEAECIGKVMEIEQPFQEMQLSFCGGPVNGDEILDQCEGVIAQLGEHDMVTTHNFTPGMYIRQIFIPARTILTSRIHLTEHPYVISKGDISVWTKETKTMRLKAPHSGITKPGTRRLLFAHDDTIWTTFHATNDTDADSIVDTITTTRNVLEVGK